MANHIETITVEGSEYTYDHTTGIATAKHPNGYTETWDAKNRLGATLDMCFLAYLFLTSQWDRYELYYDKHCNKKA